MEMQTELINQQRDDTMLMNSHCKKQQDTQNQQSQNDKFTRDNQSRTSVEQTEYEDDEDEDNEEKFNFEDMQFPDARMGVCSICRFSIKSSDATMADFEKAIVCCDGHLLCHKCVQRHAIQSDMNCVLCAASESRKSPSSISRASSAKSINPKRRNRGPGLRARRDKRNKDETYKAPTTLSHTYITSHYEVGFSTRSGDENWGDTEHEDVNDEEEIVTQHVPSHIPPVTKQRSFTNMQRKEEPFNVTKVQIKDQRMVESSRRPIQCPRLDCAVNVAFSALTNHFIFDHPEVPRLCVDPEEKITFIVNFDGLIYDSSHCLALLLVSGKLWGPAASQFNGNHKDPQYKNRLPLPILAARLHCNVSRSGNEDGYDDGRDVVIAWVAGSDISNSALRCSIQAIDSIDLRSITYTGPVNSLRTAQKAKEVFLTGDCVILHDGFMKHIHETTPGRKNLNFNITIH